jgi:hypothetical protein
MNSAVDMQDVRFLIDNPSLEIIQDTETVPAIILGAPYVHLAFQQFGYQGLITHANRVAN